MLRTLSLVASSVMVSLSSLAGDLSPRFEQRSALAKQEALWRLITSDVYPPSELPGHLGTACSVALYTPLAFTTLFQTFNSPQDEVPKTLFFDRKRTIHAMGIELKIKYRACAGTEQTGLLGDAEGVPGILRLSVAAPLMPGVPFTPGLAIKLFVDGRPSANTVALNSLDGQGKDRNFFQHPFSTAIPRPKNPLLKLGGLWFSLFTKNPFRLSILDFSNQDKTGDPVRKPTENYALIFQPRPEVTQNYGKLLEQYGPKTDFRVLIPQLGKSLVLYDVHIKKADGTTEKVGEIETEETSVVSGWAEKKLFFNHKHSEI